MKKTLVCDIIGWSCPENKYYSQETKVKKDGLYPLIYSPMMMKRVRFDLLWLWDDYVTQNDVCVMVDVSSLLLKTLLVFLTCCTVNANTKVFIPNWFGPNLFASRFEIVWTDLRDVLNSHMNVLDSDLKSIWVSLFFWVVPQPIS